MTDRLARTSTRAEKRCRFCRGAIPPDPRKSQRRSHEKVFCGEVCRGKWHTMKHLNKKFESYGGTD